jgi:hypothetical protein
MPTSFRVSASDSTSIFDALRKFSPIKYQQGGVGQEQKPPVPPDRTYEIGDVAEGGIVIWVTDDKKHGLVVSINNLGPATWGPTDVETGATNDDPLPTSYTKPDPKANYSGYQNQEKIEAITGWQNNYPAFKACADYSITINGKKYDDWFLPSLTELRQIYNQRGVVNQKVATIQGGQVLFLKQNDPGFGFYWSSRESEEFSSFAWALFFFNGFQDVYYKFNPYAVRCVRAF